MGMDLPPDFDFLAALQQRLAQPLPGPTAHARLVSTSYRPTRLELTPNAQTRQSAVLLLLYPGPHGLYLPLTQRHPYKGVHGGQISLPGGRTEPTDRSPVETALRETHEEVGVAPDEVRVLGQLSPLYVPPSNFLIHPVVGVLPYRPDFVPEPFEVADIIEAPLTRLRDPGQLRETQLHLPDGLTIHTPYFDVQQRVVWGATAMILSEFLWVWEEIAGTAQKNQSP